VPSRTLCYVRCTCGVIVDAERMNGDAAGRFAKNGEGVELVVNVVDANNSVIEQEGQLAPHNVGGVTCRGVVSMINHNRRGAFI